MRVLVPMMNLSSGNRAECESEASAVNKMRQCNWIKSGQRFVCLFYFVCVRLFRLVRHEGAK